MAMGFEPCWLLNGETDAGKMAIGSIWNVAAAAFAAYNAYVAIQMAKKQEEIARRYLNISKAQRNWYNTVFKPLEDQELDEAWALEIHEPLYDVAIGRAQALGRFLFRNQMEKSLRCSTQYDTGQRQGALKDGTTVQAVALVAMAGTGKRNEKARVDALNDRRWQRREQVIKRGRDMMADNVVFGTLASGIYGDLGKQASQAAGGALYFLGYGSERRETVYPGALSYGRATRERSLTSQHFATPGFYLNQQTPGGEEALPGFVGPPAPGAYSTADWLTRNTINSRAPNLYITTRDLAEM